MGDQNQFAAAQQYINKKKYQYNEQPAQITPTAPQTVSRTAVQTVPTRSQYLKNITQETYNKEVARRTAEKQATDESRAAAKLKKDEERARQKGISKATPVREKVTTAATEAASTAKTAYKNYAIPAGEAAVIYSAGVAGTINRAALQLGRRVAIQQGTYYKPKAQKAKGRAKNKSKKSNKVQYIQAKPERNLVTRHTLNVTHHSISDIQPSSKREFPSSKREFPTSKSKSNPFGTHHKNIVL